MPSAPASAQVACTGGPLAAVDTDLLILPWYQDEPPSAVAGLDAATAGELSRALASTVVIPDADERTANAASEAVARGRTLGECSNLARALANEPSNTLTPREFARRTAAIAGEAGVSVEILDETHIEQLGMGLLLGVARGRNEPPRRLVVRAAAGRHAPRRRRDADRRRRGRTREDHERIVRQLRRLDQHRSPRRGSRRRSRVADAALRRLPRADQERDRGHDEHGRA